MSENPDFPNIPHPNWVALSTCHLKFKKFVKAKEQNCFSVEDVKKCNNTDLDGREIKSFYDETIKSEAFARKKKKTPGVKCETIEIIESDESDIEVVDPDGNQKLLKAIQNCELEELKAVKDCDYNCTDQFGWTALEIACVVGNREAVKYLLKKGSYIKDNEKIYRILEKKGLSDIIAILNKIGEETEVDTYNIEDSTFKHCEECGEKFDVDQKVQHQAEISHQLSLKRNISKRNPGFGISEANVGFKLMKKYGWDGVSGLGDDQSGKLFPVKTVLKQDRKGLDVGDKKKLKVTHFGPNDPESIANLKYRKQRNPAKQRKIIRRGSKWKKVPITSEQLLREDLGTL